MWATRLHLYGDDEEEQKKISATNQVSSSFIFHDVTRISDIFRLMVQVIAGLPVSTDQISAEDQLMLLGIAEVPKNIYMYTCIFVCTFLDILP